MGNKVGAMRWAILGLVAMDSGPPPQRGPSIGQAELDTSDRHLQAGGYEDRYPHRVETEVLTTSDCHPDGP